MWNYVPKSHVLFNLTVLLIDFSIYTTSAASSDEMELWSSLGNSSQLLTLNLFHKELYLIIYSSGKTKKQSLFLMPTLTNC